MPRRRLLPPTYLFVSLLSMVLLHLVTPVKYLIAYPWNLIGCAPLAAGIALNLIADAAFKKYNTTVKPFQESTALITSGAFRISRHPMYLGMILILLGVGIVMGSLTPLLVLPVFGMLMERFFVRAEEEMLERKFGEAWLVYKNQVRRWL